MEELAGGVMGAFPEISAWLLTILVFFMGLCRALSELMLFVSARTESTEDDKWPARLSKWAFWIGKAVGWFGVGVPKKIVEKKNGKSS